MLAGREDERVETPFDSYFFEIQFPDPYSLYRADAGREEIPLGRQRRREGINGFFRWVDENQYKIQYRVLKARYRGKTVCPECHGSPASCRCGERENRRGAP